MRVETCGVAAILVLNLLIACGDESQDTIPSLDETAETGLLEDTGAGWSGDQDTGVEEDAIGAETGDLLPIDHTHASTVVEQNLIEHIDGLDSTLSFLEDSALLPTIINLLSEDEDEGDEDEGDEDEGDEEGETEAEKGDDGISIDLSELRDEVVGFLLDRVLVESTATVSEDGLAITYQLSPETFCVSDDVDEDETPEETKERVEEEASCGEKITETPIRIRAVTDGADRVELSLLVGEAEAEAVRLQVHDDLLAVFAEIPNIKVLVEAFLDDDAELPETMEGHLAGELQWQGEMLFHARFAVLEDIVIASTEEDGISFIFEQAPSPGSITIDGIVQSFVGALDIGPISLTLPWQDMVSIFQSDEDGDEPPEVTGAFVVSIPGITGELDFSDDALSLTRVGLGDVTTTVSVDADPIIGFDLNPEGNREVAVHITALSSEDVQVSFIPKLDARVELSMHHVADDIEDLPEVLLDETIGVLLDGSTSPAIRSLTGEESVEVQIASGQLTLWSSAMSEDVVIGEGLCVGGYDEDLTEEEQEQQHDLFGGLVAVTCAE